MFFLFTKEIDMSDCLKLHVEVSGPDRGGKGLLIALIAHYLEGLGIPVVVQGAETHNKDKLGTGDEELSARLQVKHVQVVFTEMQTSPRLGKPAE